MPSIDEHLRLRSGGTRQQQSHTPVGNIRVIERRLKRLVFDEQALGGGQLGMAGPQVVLKPAFALPDVGRSRIVGPVGEPHGDVSTVECASDFDTVLGVSNCDIPNRFVRVAEGTVFIALILKKVRIDGPGLHAIDARQSLDLSNALKAGREIPLHMQRNARTYPRQLMYPARVAKLLLDRGRGGRLRKFSEPSPGIRESPRRDFDGKAFQRSVDSFSLS